MRIQLARPFACVAVAALVGTLAGGSAFGQGNQKSAARCEKVYGALLMHGANHTWKSVAAGSTIPADKLVVVLFGAECESPNGGVLARLFADVGQRGPFPVLESAARFHEPGTADMDITFERGVVVLINTKKSGAAKVRLRVRDETFDVTLNEPKARVGIEVYGRHLPGFPQVTDAKKDVPVATMALFALEGESLIATDKSTSRLHAPPGPAMFLWDSVSRTSEVQRFETLPDSVKPMTPKERQAFETISGHAKKWFADTTAIGKALDMAINSRDATERKAAVVALGAVGDLPRLVNALSDKDHADVRDMAVLATRHWLGREAGQSVRLYEYLTKAEKYTPVQAKNLLYLLNGIEEERRRDPASYAMLIQGLNYSKMPVRELAHWHLMRLVPDSKSIPYDAAAPEASRLEWISQYRKLVPDGELPKPSTKSSNP